MAGRQITVEHLAERVDGLERKLDALQRTLEAAFGGARAVEAWAAQYGIDLSEFEDAPYDPFAEGSASMTVEEAAQALDIGPEQTRRHLRAGRLAGLNLGGRRGWRVSRRSVEALAALRREAPPYPLVFTGPALPDPPISLDEAQPRVTGDDTHI